MENWSKALKRAWSWAKETLIKKEIIGEIKRETEKAVMITCLMTEGSTRYFKDTYKQLGNIKNLKS